MTFIYKMIFGALVIELILFLIISMPLPHFLIKKIQAFLKSRFMKNIYNY